MRPILFIVLTLVLTGSPVRAQDLGNSGLQVLARRAELDIREMVDFADTTTARLVGVGLVTGLQGTGSEAGSSAVTGPLIAALKSQGVYVGTAEELEASRSAALVLISVRIPSTGALKGDQLDAIVTAQLGATSLVGGRLLIAPLRQHLPGDGVVAFAEGSITVEDPANPMGGRIRGGVELIQDLITHEVGHTFDLKVKLPYAGYSATELIASTLNEAYYNTDEPGLPPIAHAINSRIVRITVPEADRESLAAFMKFILSRRVRDPELLNLPARVIVNRKTGAIIATADVEFSPVGVTHEALNFTVTQPAQVATEQAPITTQERWAPVAPTANQGERAKLSDLLAALRALDVPVREQIELLVMMHKMGSLHAQLMDEEQ
jgi:flagellar P-ring protein precursor FlgI